MNDGHADPTPAQDRPDRPAPVRVLSLIDHPAVGGGAEQVAFELTVGLDRQRFARTLCISRWAPEFDDPAAISRFTTALDESDVTLLALRRRGPADARAWLELLRTLRRERIDVLHAHKFGSNVWGSLLGRAAGVPVIVAHEHSWSYEGRPLRRLLDRHLVARLSDAFLAVSSQDRSRMIAIEGIDPDRIVELHNAIRSSPPQAHGAAPRSRLGIPAGAPVVGIVAIQRPEKRIDLLVRAAALLRPRFPDLCVLLIGGGPPDQTARIGALIAEHDLEGVVRPLGARTDVPDLLATLDVAVLCSDREGHPLALLEYMEAGLPIVATEVGGLPGLLDHGRCGVLVAPGDAEALAAGIGRLLDDRELAARLGAAACRRRRTEFDLEQTVERLGSIYERLLVRRRRRTLRIETLEDFAAAGEDWDRLAVLHGGPFARREFHAAWWRHLGSGELLLLACHRPGGELVAIVPLYRTRRAGLRVLRFLGSGPFDELGPVCAPEHRALVLAALRAELERGALDADMLLAERLPGDDCGDTGNALGGRVVNRDLSPVIESGGLDWDGFLAQRSRNFREQVRRRERALHRHHDARFRLGDDRQRLQADMTALFALHHARWGAASEAFTPAREALHREVAAAALREGWLRLWLLEVAGAPVAVWYGFRSGGREWYYQAGRDPAFERDSIGFVLLAHTLRAAIEDGVTEYRMLRGGEAYKSRFATREDELQTRVLGGTVVGRVAARAVAVAAGRPAARARLKKFERRPGAEGMVEAAR